MENLGSKCGDELVMRPQGWGIFGAEWSRSLEIVNFVLNLVLKFELDFEIKSMENLESKGGDELLVRSW